MQNLNSFLVEELTELKAKKLYRSTTNHLASYPGIINFSSNDYLGLASRIFNPADFYQDRETQKFITEGKVDIFSESSSMQDTQVSLFNQNSVEPGPSISGIQYGSSGSRLTTGTHAIHEKLENFIAEWKHSEAALLFSSGYLANLGTLAALLNPRDVVFSDEYNHACIFDGIRLSGAKKFIYKHSDIEHLTELLTKHRNEFAKAIIVTDSVFSMDGDKAKLEDIVKLSKQFSSSVYVDEAHATGILGTTGAGLVEELVDAGKIKYADIAVQMGTFSKAVGLEGAYIAGSSDLINFLKNKARTFVYSTASSPLIINRILANLKTIKQDNLLRATLKNNILFFKSHLKQSHLKWTNEDSAIFSIELGDIEKTLEASQQLKEKGLLVLAIRPPTAPTPRLRVCISAKHSEVEINKLAEELKNI